MLKSILYTEWIKTRWISLLTTVVSLVLVSYASLRVGKAISIKGAAHIWEIMLTHDTIFIQLLTYMPIFVGLAIALFQFVPEMQQKRLKLTLHLPLSQQTIIGAMLLYGLGIIVLLFALNFLVLFLFFQARFAPELISRILLSALPWYTAGIAIYGFAAWVCLEPTWKRRIVNALIALAFIRLFFVSAIPEAYNGSIVLLIILSLLVTSFSYISVKRFKEGKQD